MAPRMYPERLPTEVDSSAERKVYHLLKASLTSDYTVIYDIPLTTLKSYHGIEDRQIDFLVLHPQKGILILEVKGGRVSCDSKQGKWYSRDHNNDENVIKDPFKQALECRQILIRQLQGETSPPLLRSACRNCFFGRAVVFPDTPVNRGDFVHSTNVEVDLILDREDMEAQKMKVAIENIYNTPHQMQPLGEDAINQIINIYAPTWNMRSPMIIQLEEEDIQFEELTEQQFMALGMLSEFKRVGIYGCAGSGKTFLAIEQARRLALRGNKVLLTCITYNLAVWLRQLIKKKMKVEEALGNIEIRTFNSLNKKLLRLAARSGLLTTSDRYSSFDRTQFDNSYDERLLSAIPSLGESYDAIIVDEGQDFDERYWELLQALLRSRVESLLYVFYDENQIINGQGRIPKYPVPVLFPLPYNCRNTKKIHEAVIKYYKVGEPPVCKPTLPEGREIENIIVNDLIEDGKKELAALLKRLVCEEQIPIEEIVLLSPYNSEKSNFYDQLKLENGFELSWKIENSSKRNTLTCSSIAAFKGLERRVVILVETKFIWDEKLWYIALSRARQLLFIIEDNPFL